MKNNKEKRIMKDALSILFAIVIMMSLFACKSKTNIVMDNNQAKIDVNSPEVQAILGKVRNYEAEKLLPSGTAKREKQVWTKRNHKWAEPPEEDKIYLEGSKNGGWVSAYTYQGKEYWVVGSNMNKDTRYIYKKTSSNYQDAETTDRVAVIDGKENAPISQILAEVSLSEDISKNMRGNADTINITR